MVIHAWWKPNFTSPEKISYADATARVREQFLKNVQLHLRSDVPLGAALSGGIDSSSVVCAMRHIEPDADIHTFSYIARGYRASEEKWVDMVNSHTNAIEHKVVASNVELARDLDKMIIAQGEPFGSTSIYAQYRVFQLAKENGITVTLDGQGADELLAGYFGYPGSRLLSLIEEEGFLSAHRFASNWKQYPGRSYKNAVMLLVQKVISDSMNEKARKLMGRDSHPAWLDVNLMKESNVNLKEVRQFVSPTDYKGRRVIESLVDSLTRRGLIGLLRHGDRNSMAFSIESRVPFLTLPMANLLLSLPENFLISNQGQTKQIFRDALKGIVPEEILFRKDKIGFETPEIEWLLSMPDTLREWIGECDTIPFINRDELLKEFDLVITGKKKFTPNVWRWINYVRWYNISGITNN